MKIPAARLHRLALLVLIGAVAGAHAALLEVMPRPAPAALRIKAEQGSAPAAMQVSVLTGALEPKTEQPPAMADRRVDARADLATRAGPVAPEEADARAPTHETHATEAFPYFSAKMLDRGALPRSAPDALLLDGLALSGLPLKLRILIDATGQVVDVLPLQMASDDAQALQRLRAMFVATAYIPGRRDGQDVPSYVDIDLSIEAIGGATMGP